MNTAKFYKLKSKFYRMNASRKRHILDLVPKDTRTVLDIGCATGELASVLKDGGMDVVGVDISEEALLEARKFLSESFCFNLESEEWPETLMARRFDLVVASEVIEHLFDTDLFLNKAKSLMATKGRLIITTPNFLFWKNRLKVLFGKFKYEETGLLDSGHIRFFTIPTIKEALEKSGFLVEREHHFYPNLYKRKLNFLGNIFPGLFAYQIILKARPNNEKE